jgi:threonine/homoserine/homoserine lactone efflux protein
VEIRAGMRAQVSCAPAVRFSLLLGLIHAIEAISWFTLLAIAMRPLAYWLQLPSTSTTIERFTGGVLFFFGLALLIERRAWHEDIRLSIEIPKREALRM